MWMYQPGVAMSEERRGEGAIAGTRAPATESADDVEVARLAASDTYSWWVRGRRALIASVLRKHARKVAGQVVADLGCGAGGLCEVLRAYGRVVGVDRSSLSVKICQRKGYAMLVRGCVERLPLVEGGCDVVAVLDVLEHVVDDERVLVECNRVLRPGGTLVLTVPAIPALYGHHDRALGHLRRYSLSSLRRLVRSCGFELVRATYFNGLLLPVVAAVRFGRQLRRRTASLADPLVLPGVWNDLAYGVLALERRILEVVDLPLGLSLLCIAKRVG
jgi:SAM-dependent methyltransferase